MSVHHMFAFGAQKRAVDPLGLVLGKVVSCQWVLGRNWKSIQYSHPSPLSSLSCLHIFRSLTWVFKKL